MFQVVRAAEEAASTLASSIHPEQCIKVLCPIIQTADYPINLAAIKMQTKVVERIAKESLLQLLADIIPGLLQVGPSRWLAGSCLLRAVRSGAGTAPQPPGDMGAVRSSFTQGAGRKRQALTYALEAVQLCGLDTLHPPLNVAERSSWQIRTVALGVVLL